MVFPEKVAEHQNPDLIDWDEGGKQTQLQTSNYSTFGFMTLGSSTNRPDTSTTSGGPGSELLTIKTNRRAFKNPVDREQTAQTRLLIACVRCRMQRIRVRTYQYLDLLPC
jgi:hypothetical protein